MLRKLRYSSDKNEEGFTLVELMVVLVIIGVLAALAYTIVNDHMRQAVIATVKSDIRSSVAQTITKTGAFFTPEEFAARAVVSDGNGVYLTLEGGTEKVACVWGTHIFGENDVVSYYWSSATGKISEGTCIGEDGTGVGGIDAGVDDLEETEEEHGEYEDEVPVEPETPGGAVGGDVTFPEEEIPAPPVVVPPVETGPIAPVGKVVFCHGSNGKWKSNSANVNGILNGHAPHHNGDIVPPIAGKLPKGQNWTSTGIAVWENGCKKP